MEALWCTSALVRLSNLYERSSAACAKAPEVVMMFSPYICFYMRTVATLKYGATCFVINWGPNSHYF